MFKSRKEIVLYNFLENNKNLPKQGSNEWLKARLETIGGSEISTVLGLNPYQNIKQLIKQKIGLTSFKKSAPLWFGNLFENILQNYTEKIFNTKVYETGSISNDKTNLIKYSPDGLSIINKNNLLKVFPNLDIDQINSTSIFNNSSYKYNKDLLVLFEFKNPFMRVIKKNTIPTYYINQPVLGMEIIDICEFSIFIESVFRFCSFLDIIDLNNKYNTRYHYDKIRYSNMPLAFGCFSLYYEITQNTNSEFNNLLNDINHYLYNSNIDHDDLSNISDKKIVNRILENIIDFKDIKIIYHDICINDNNDNNKDNCNNEDNCNSIYLKNIDPDINYFNKYNNINKFLSDIHKNKELISNNKQYQYLGIMSFKMFDINIQPIYKKQILTNPLLDKLQKLINVIKLCNETNDTAKQKKIIDNYEIK
jgi:hypothetical protein